MYFSEQGNVDDDATFIMIFQFTVLLPHAVCSLQPAVCGLWSAVCSLHEVEFSPVYDICRLQTADRRLQTADCRLEYIFWGKILAVLFICGKVFLQIAEKKPKLQTLETAKILCHTVVYQIFLAMGLRSQT